MIYRLVPNRNTLPSFIVLFDKLYPVVVGFLGNILVVSLKTFIIHIGRNAQLFCECQGKISIVDAEPLDGIAAWKYNKPKTNEELI